MNEKMQRKMLRGRFGVQGWTLLVYYLIMNICVTAAVLVQTMAQMLDLMAKQGMDGFDRYLDVLLENLMGNAWGYFLAAAIGFVILIFWKGKRFVFGELWTPGRPMTLGSFWGTACILVSGQLVFQIVALIMEFVFNLFGLSVVDAMESATLSYTDSFSMFLYSSLLAPVAEEILFRGVIQRSLMPYGKKFAILASAVLFGAFHGNLVQSPFAFFVGLILGYVAAEYSILWAMVLHMFNNLAISDFMTRITSLLPMGLGDLVSWLVIVGMSIAGAVVLIVKWSEVKAWFRSDRIQGKYVRAFFAAPGIIVLLIVMLANALMSVSTL